MPQLINEAEVTGEYQSVPVNAETQAVVELNAFEIVKTPSKQIWVDGQLGYTITVENLDEAPGDPIENMVITDTIDPEIAVYVDGSATVTMGGVAVPGATVDYNAVTGLLTVTVGADVPAGETVTVTFLVDKV